MVTEPDNDENKIKSAYPSILKNSKDKVQIFNPTNSYSSCKNKLNCIYSNVDVLSNKIDEIENYLTNHNVDIAAFVETKPKKQINLTSTNKDSDKIKVNPVISGYKIEEDPSGRGICLLVKDSLQVNR